MPAGFLSPGNEVFARTRRIEHPGLRLDRAYLITTAVSDPAVVRAFAGLVDVDEYLGTVPVRALAEV